MRARRATYLLLAWLTFCSKSPRCYNCHKNNLFQVQTEILLSLSEFLIRENLKDFKPAQKWSSFGSSTVHNSAAAGLERLLTNEVTGRYLVFCFTETILGHMCRIFHFFLLLTRNRSVFILQVTRTDFNRLPSPFEFMLHVYV